MACHINFSAVRSVSDPHEIPILIIGLAKNLAKLTFKDVAANLEPRVTEEVTSCFNSFVSLVNLN